MKFNSTLLSLSHFIVLLLLLGFTWNIGAQTTLGPGDIAFTSFSSDAPDQFSFVLLKDVTAGTTFVITDDEFDGTNLVATATSSEGRLRVTFTNAFTCGSEFSLVSPGGTGGDFPNGAGYTLVEESVFGTTLQFSTSGDALIAFQDANSNTTSPATFIAALNNSGSPFGTANTPAGNTQLPTGLVVGQSAVAIDNGGTEFDNVRYLATASSSGTPAALATSLNTRSNWEGSDVTYGAPLTYGFNCQATCIDPTFNTGLSQNPAGNPCPTASVNILIDGDLGTNTQGWFLRTGSAIGPIIQGPAVTSLFTISSIQETTTYFVTAAFCSGPGQIPASITITTNGTAADAGPDQFNLPSTSTFLGGSDPAPGTGMWTIVSGDGNGFLGDASSPTSTFIGTAGQSYELSWTVFNAPCATTNDQVEISFSAPSSLIAGDLAFTGYNSTDPDEWSFVLLTDVNAGTAINFTDNGWLSSGSFRSGEGTVVVTLDRNYSCGSELYVSEMGNNAFEVFDTDGTLAGTATVSGSAIQLAIAGDQLFAFQGNFNTPTLLAGIQMNGAWDANAIDNTTSAESTILATNSASLAISPEVDNAEYNCAVTSGSATALRTAINDPTNWTSGSTSFDLSDGCNIQECTPCVLPNLMSFGSNVPGSPTPICAGTEATFTITGDLNGADRWVVFFDVCGGTIVSETTTNTLTFVPTMTGRYWIGATGGCVSSPSCLFVDLTVDPSSCNMPPVAACQPVTASADINCQAAVDATAFDGGSSDPDGDPLAFSINPPGPFPVGVTTVILTVSDGTAVDTCSTTITVFDAIAPVVTCLDSVTFNLDQNGEYLIVSSVLQNLFNASDNCSSITVSQGGLPNPLTCLNLGIYANIPFYFTDAGGNMDTCIVNVTVQDTVPPQALCRDINLALDPNGNASLTGSDLDNGSSDNCGIVSYSVTPNTFDCTSLGANSVTMVVTDQSGNTASCTATVTVTDTIAPTAICRVGTNVFLDANGMATVPIDSIDGGSFDNCGPIQLSHFRTTVSCLDLFTPVFDSLFVIDASGNSNRCLSVLQVLDTIRPQLTCQDATLNLDSSGVAFLELGFIQNQVIVTSSDNCGIDALEASSPFGQISNGVPLRLTCDELGIFSLQVTAIDESGNSISRNVTITVLDPLGSCNMPPFAACQPVFASADINCEAVLDATVFDDGSFDPDGDPLTFSIDPPGPFSVGVTTVILTVSDGAAISRCTTSVTVQDNRSPTVACAEFSETFNRCPDGLGPNTPSGDWMPVPASGIVQSSVGGSSIADLDFNCITDNCSLIGEIEYRITRSFEENRVAGCSVDLLNEYQVRDAAGNVSPDLILFRGQIRFDGPPPVVTAPADATVECGAATDPSAVGMATATSGCGTPVVTFSDQSVPGCGRTETITRTWTATDACGQTADVTQLITVVDTTPPSITCPADATVGCGMSTAPATTGMATGSDVCGTVLITFIDNTVPGCGNTETITRTWTATDECGNPNTCVQIISVVDTTPPSISCPPDVTIECNVTNRTPNALGNATGSDDCSMVSSIVHNDFANLAGCSNTGVIIRTFIATNGCGQTNSCTQIITIVDTTPPTIVVPPDETVECGESTDPSATGTAIGTDGCSTVSVSYLDSSVPGCGNTETITRMWTVTDACGNPSSSPQIITVVDTTPPSITCPADATVECGMSTAPATTGMATGSDVCGTVLITFIDNTVPGCGNTETITRTWTATDECGNPSTCVQIITIVDTTPPIVACTEFSETFNRCPDGVGPNTPNGMWVSIPASGLVQPAVGGSSVATIDLNCISDNCGPVGDLEIRLTSSFEENRVPGCSVDILNEYEVRDGCGNVSPDLILYRGQLRFDGPPPVLVIPPAIRVECGTSTAPAVTGTATATSGCGTPVVTFTDQVNPFCGLTETITRTWLATDACGKTSTATQLVITEDTTPPTITGAPDITVNCDDDLTPAGTGTPVATDVCSAGAPTLISADDLRPGSCPGNYTIRRTWTATDECFNSSSYLQIITVQDIEGPVFAEAPGDLDVLLTNVALDAFGSGLCLTALDLTGVEAAINAGLTAGATGITGITFPTPTDACSDPITTTATVVVNPATAECLAFIDVTYTSTDACGNSSDYMQQLSVIDVAPPVLTVPAPNVTVECDMPTDVAATGSPVFVDECPGAIVTITNTDVEVADPNCPNGKTITRTFTATDPCGNTATQVQIITVVDTEAPVYTSFPRDTTVECSSLSGMRNEAAIVKTVADARGFPTVEDNCSTGLLAPFTDVFTLSTNCPTVGIYERIFAPIDDGCGNILPARTLTITVIDTMKPIFTSIPIGGDFDCTVGIPPLGTATAVDCDPNVVVTEVDDETIVGVNQVVSITERTITARDFCGNETSQVETYRVLDQVGPFLLSCPADIGPIVARPDDRATVNFATPVFDDNCSFSVSGTHASGEDFPVGLTQVTYTAIDGGGNITICEFTIEVVKALNLTCLDHDISIDNAADLTRADINFPYAATDCDACPQGEPLPSLDYLGYFRGHRYYTSVAGDTRSWTEAQRHAVSLGGRLVEVNSAEENLFLQRESPHAQALIGHFTGPRSTTWTGTFSPVIFENWASGFPTTGTNEFFALLSNADGTHTNANHSEMPYIVEFPCVEIDVIGMTSDSLFGQGIGSVTYSAVDLCGNRDTCEYTIGINTFDVVYCTPFVESFGGEADYYITGVEVNAFAKTFDASSIYLHTRDTIELDEDSANSFSFSAETSGVEAGAFPAYWRVWVDANQDGDFYDAGELIHEAFGDASATGTLDLPSALQSVSPTRIRVAFSRYGYPEACGDNPFGDIKDFSLISNTVRAPRLMLAGARGIGQHHLTTSSEEDPEIASYLMLRGASADDLTKIDFWDALYGDGNRHTYELADTDPAISAYYQAVALDDQGFTVRSSNIVHLTMPTRRGPVRVFPNPAYQHVDVELGEVISDLPYTPVKAEPNGELHLFDALGRIVQTQSFAGDAARVRMQLPQLATGTYMLRVTRPNTQPETVRVMIDQSGGSKVPRA